MARRLAVLSVLLYFFRFSWPAATLPAAPNSKTTPTPLQIVHGLQSTNNTGKLDTFHLNTSFGNTINITNDGFSYRIPSTGYVLYLFDFGDDLPLSDLQTGYEDIIESIEGKISAGEGGSVASVVAYDGTNVEIFYRGIQSPHACTYRSLLLVFTALQYITANQSGPSTHIGFSRASRYRLYWHPDPQQLSEAIGGGFIGRMLQLNDVNNEVSSDIDSSS
ncbi:hypothetical protein ABVK25_000226 [Lepraria finkii]|uniref:Uncharacterized protein n=1 Tax=Lepraria finkii TaxID=1340010 RepID=A0ABR4BMA9_9LECA